MDRPDEFAPREQALIIGHGLAQKIARGETEN